MEDFIVRFVKNVITVVILSTILSSTPASVLRQQDAGAETVDPNNLAGYYGFGEMEIVKLDWDIKGLRIADFNGDGRSDIAVVNDRKARIELLIQNESVGPGETPVAVDLNDVDINIINPPTRFQKEFVAVSQKVFSFVCGDLNSDKLMDLAFYGEPKGLYVVLQKAGETEAGIPKSLSWRTRRKISIDDGLVTANALACADLNNDGRDDLALAGRDGVYIILQKEDGSLAEPMKYPTTAMTLGVEVGDLNGDRINDLILVTNDREKPLHVRFGLETGQLGPQVQFFIERPLALEVRNIDGEAGDEVLIVDAISKRLTCYKFASEKDMDGDWPILFYPFTSGEGNTKRDLAIGDFDGDGLADVAVSDPAAAEIILYKQTKGIGLAEPVKFPVFADVESLSAADINNDKKAEIAVLSVKEKVIGIAEFEDERLSFPQPIAITGEPAAMELADIDRGGSIDCVYISKDVNDIRHLRIIYNLGETKGEQQESDEAEPALELKGLVSNPDGLKILDVDQDGLDDVLIFVKYELPILVRQTQRRKFEIIDSPGAQMSLIKDATLGSAASANVDDNAGDELLVAQKNFARSLVFTRGKSWSIIDQYNAKGTENQISAVAAFDIDGKGSEERPAILLLDGQKGRLQILKAGDDNTYRFEKEINVDTWNAAARHLKMLFASLTGGEAESILLFDGDKFALVTPPSGSFLPKRLEQQFSYETKIKDGMYGNMVTGDINGDGRIDIIMVEYNRNHIEILAIDNDMKPIPAMRFKIFEQKSYREAREQARISVEPRELRVADATGDGKNDLVTIIHDRIIIYPQD
ncbi:MAG: VCBS repeat-containing protein [Sedimentisphaerales bacterium]|nr:VCBS repeat-containing protein [Sedimentisphaerales bacterium]